MKINGMQHAAISNCKYIVFSMCLGNFTYSGFPSALGAVDGTLIPIQASHEREFDYLCRKGFHAINVQVIYVDDNDDDDYIKV